MGHVKLRDMKIKRLKETVNKKAKFLVFPAYFTLSPCN